MRRDFDFKYPTVDELRPYLGDNWAICRATIANLARYGRCITAKQFAAAQDMAVAARAVA